MKSATGSGSVYLSGQFSVADFLLHCGAGSAFLWKYGFAVLIAYVTVRSSFRSVLLKGELLVIRLNAQKTCRFTPVYVSSCFNIVHLLHRSLNHFVEAVCVSLPVKLILSIPAAFESSIKHYAHYAAGLTMRTLTPIYSTFHS